MTSALIIAAIVVAWLVFAVVVWRHRFGLRRLESEAEAGHRGPPLRFFHPLHGLHGLDSDLPLAAGRYTIGRDQTNDIVLSSPFVSRHHAMLLVSESGVRIQCLPGAKGVFVRRSGFGEFEDCGAEEVSIGPKDVVTLGKPKLNVWFSLPLTGESGRAATAQETPEPAERASVWAASQAESHHTAILPMEDEEEAGTIALPSVEGSEGPVTASDNEDEAPTFQIGLKWNPPSREPDLQRGGPTPPGRPPPSRPRRARRGRRVRPSR